jgi:hypothetical protein
MTNMLSPAAVQALKSLWTGTTKRVRHLNSTRTLHLPPARVLAPQRGRLRLGSGVPSSAKPTDFMRAHGPLLRHSGLWQISVWVRRWAVAAQMR